MQKFYKLLSVLSYYKFLRALSKGVVAGVEHKEIITSLFCNTVLDIGANKGQFALVTRRCFPQAQIVSFEPLAKPAKRFRSVFKNDPNVTLHQTAIGPQADEVIIHVSAADDSSSLFPISPLQTSVFPGTREIRTERVKVGRLADYVAPEEIVAPALLKLDVQGYELEALRGCEELLYRFSHVYVECSFVELYCGQPLADDIIAWLQDRSWSLKGVYNMINDRKGRNIQADFLFDNAQFLSAVN